MFTHLLDLLKRSPETGDGKEFAMPEAPIAPAQAAVVAAPAPPAVEGQIAALADAVRELSRSHQALLDVVSRVTPSTSASTPEEPARLPAQYVGREIVGDPGDGLRPAAAVDYARLSPLQQIALGLRHATPVGPSAARRRAGVRDAAMMTADDEGERARAGAD